MVRSTATTPPLLTALAPAWSRLTTARWLAPVFVAGVLLVAYVRTLLPGAVGGDAGELQFAGPLLALVHPTGQPLYVLLGWIWIWMIPFGSVAWRMNLLAAISGAGAGAATAWAVSRWTRHDWVGIAAGLALGFGATYWGQAVLADKYAFSALMVTLSVGIGLVWAEERRAGPSPSADRWFLIFCGACGLGLAHHRTILPVLAGLGLMAVLIEGKAIVTRLPRTIVGLALVLGPALVLYPTVLPWLRGHNATVLVFQPNTATEWLDYLLERHFIATAFDFSTTVSTSVLDRLAIFARTLQEDHTPIVALIAVFGAAALIVRVPRIGWPLVAMFALVGGLAANYRGNERQFTYYLPSFVILIYAYGYGLASAWNGLQWLATTGPRYRPALLALLVVAGPLGAQLIRAYPLRRAEALVGQPLDIWRQDLKTGNMAERLAAALEDLPADALVLGDWEQITPLWYYQHVEGRRPDLTLRYPIDQVPPKLGVQSVCLTRHLPIDPALHPTNVGAFVCLQAEPATTLGKDYQPLGITLSTPEGVQALELYGYRWAGSTYLAGQHAPLILAWRALGVERADYSVSLRILNEAWQPIWSTDIGAPVLGLYPTSRWATGELVTDYHELSVARELAPGRYLWAVVVYRQLPEGSFLELRDPNGNTQILGGTLDVLPR